MNLQDPTVLKYYNTAGRTFFFFIWAALSLQRHLICLSEEHVNAVCNSPFKRHRPAFVEHSEEPLFPSLEKPALALEAWNQKKGHGEGKLFPGASAALHCWYGLLWREVEWEVEESLFSCGSSSRPSVSSSLHLTPHIQIFCLKLLRVVCADVCDLIIWPSSLGLWLT